MYPFFERNIVGFARSLYLLQNELRVYVYYHGEQSQHAFHKIWVCRVSSDQWVGSIHSGNSGRVFLHGEKK